MSLRFGGLLLLLFSLHAIQPKNAQQRSVADQKWKSISKREVFGQMVSPGDLNFGRWWLFQCFHLVTSKLAKNQDKMIRQLRPDILGLNGRRLFDIRKIKYFKMVKAQRIWILMKGSHLGQGKRRFFSGWWTSRVTVKEWLDQKAMEMLLGIFWLGGPITNSRRSWRD